MNSRKQPAADPFRPAPETARPFSATPASASHRWNLDETIRRTSRFVSAQKLGQSGIESVRVLSESQFEQILSHIVESRLAESRLAEHHGGAAQIDSELIPVVVIDDDPEPPAGSLDPDTIERLIEERLQAGRSAAARTGGERPAPSIAIDSILDHVRRQGR